MLITSYYYFYGAGKLAVVEGITVYLFDMNDIPTLLTMSAFAWRVIFLFLFFGDGVYWVMRDVMKK